MIIIGEKINTSIKSINEAVSSNDASYIKDIVSKQIACGANYLDVNCGTFVDDEAKIMEWLVEQIKSISEIPLSIDSPNPKAIRAGIERFKSSNEIIINSITAESERWDSILPIILEYSTSVIALCMDDNGIPDTADDRLRIALLMADNFVKKGINIEKIYFDPMVKPISTDSQNGVITLETISKIRKELPESHIVCGLSNISYGLPTRKILNQAFLVGAILYGLDTAIVNPIDKNLMSLLYATEALAGNDEYCMEYINKFRSGYFD